MPIGSHDREIRLSSPEEGMMRAIPLTFLVVMSQLKHNGTRKKYLHRYKVSCSIISYVPTPQGYLFLKWILNHQQRWFFVGFCNGVWLIEK